MTGSFVQVQVLGRSTGLLAVLEGVSRGGGGQCPENLPLPAPERDVNAAPPTGCLSVALMAQGAQTRPYEVLATPPVPHGQETLEARRGRVEAMTRIRLLVDLGVLGGFIRTRISGRRPG